MLLRYWILSAIAVVSPAQTFTSLATFNGTNGYNPQTSLVHCTDGNFYGGTFGGGAHGDGTIFKITPSGTLTTLYSFGSNTDDGGAPNGLIQGTDGNFYGTGENGGTDNGGTVFKITAGGTLTTLRNFSGPDGYTPVGALMQGTDGNFYGTTSFSGTGAGTVFKITSSGTLTTLHSFTGGADGGAPLGALIQPTDGNFYGATSAGGGVSGGSSGTVFKITPGGTLTTLYTFTTVANGASPYAGLIQGSDGNFYGTTNQGGSHGAGTVFEITAAGTLTTLISLVNTTGTGPYAGLIQGTDGNFYGPTTGGGAHADGAIFKITAAGTLTTPYSFTGGADGRYAQGGLIEGTNGNLYGTTQYSGANDDGTVFELQTGLTVSPAPTITVVQNAESGASTIAPNTWSRSRERISRQPAIRASGRDRTSSTVNCQPVWTASA